MSFAAGHWQASSPCSHHPQECVCCQGCCGSDRLLLGILHAAGRRSAATARLLAASRRRPHCRQPPLDAPLRRAAEAQSTRQGRRCPGCLAAGGGSSGQRRHPAQGHGGADRQIIVDACDTGSRVCTLRKAALMWRAGAPMQASRQNPGACVADTKPALMGDRWKA